MINELVDSQSANERLRMENGKVDILKVLLERGKCFCCNFLLHDTAILRSAPASVYCQHLSRTVVYMVNNTGTVLASTECVLINLNRDLLH